jgi:two-component system LytT family response regulator
MSTLRPLRALLIEDEIHARRYLRELLSAEEGVAIVGEAETGTTGAELIRTLDPDLVFLDVQMPELDGFGMIERLGSARMPAFIFVTAYPEYAVRAFEIEAVDYLCKPFDRQRLAAAVQRARRQLATHTNAAGHAGDGTRDAAALPASQAGEPWFSRITVKEDAGITFVPVDQVLWIEAANKYVVIHSGIGTHVARMTIQYVATRLDPKQFVRIHRSILVRKSAVRGLHPLFHGDYTVKLTDGTELTLSRTFREAFFDAMSR